VGGEARALFLDMNGRALRAAPVGPEHPQRPPVWDRLAEVRAPTLVVWGDLDVPHVPARGEVLARTIPGARRHVVTGTAHLPQLERPDEVTALLSRFLALVGASR
jgi:pimeloyl-ACP methyl ester carboxylesterase